MIETASIEKHGTVTLTVREIAELWSKLTDDGQALFFEEAGQIMNAWTAEGRAVFFGADGQQYAIGRHLATCACITDVGRGVVETIYRAMTRKTP